MPVMEKRRLATRDLSQNFRRFRAQHFRKKAGGDGKRIYPGSESLLSAGASSDPESPHARPQACLPPQWVDFADKAKEDIKEIRDQLAQLAKAQQRRLLRFTDDVSDKEVEGISAAINTQIRVCEQSIHQVRTFGMTAGSSIRDDEYRQNTQRNLAAQLQQLSKQVRESQKEYMQEVRRREQQSRAVDLEGGAGAGGLGASGGAYGPTQAQMHELETMEEFAAQRSQEIAQIASSIEELNRIFRELAVIVIDQGSILDRIDYNTEQIYEKSAAGREQMEKAVNTKKKNDTRAAWCFMVWAAMDVVALAILLVKWQLKYGLKNVLIFVFWVSVLGAGVWYGWRYLQPVLCPRLTSMFQIIPEGWDPASLWKRIRPAPVNAAKAAAAASGAGGGAGGAIGGGLSAMRHVWRPPGQ